MAINKLDIKAITASEADSRYVTKPDDALIKKGWQKENGGMTTSTDGKPPVEYFNYLEKRQDEAIAYIQVKGGLPWDNTYEYKTNDIVAYNGFIYKAIRNNTNRQPPTDTTYKNDDWHRTSYNIDELKSLLTPATTTAAGVTTLTSTLVRDDETKAVNSKAVLAETDDIRRIVRIPVGSIMLLAKDQVDASWLLCDGSRFDITTYKKLHSILNSDILPNKSNNELTGLIGAYAFDKHGIKTLKRTNGHTVDISSNSVSTYYITNIAASNGVYAYNSSNFSLPATYGLFIRDIDESGTLDEQRRYNSLQQDAVQQFNYTYTGLNGYWAWGSESGVFSTVWHDIIRRDSYQPASYQHIADRIHRPYCDSGDNTYHAIRINFQLQLSNEKLGLRQSAQTRPYNVSFKHYVKTGDFHDDKFAYYIKATDEVVINANLETITQDFDFLKRKTSDNTVHFINLETRTRTVERDIDNLEALVASNQSTNIKKYLREGTKGIQTEETTNTSEKLITKYGYVEVSEVNRLTEIAYTSPFEHECINVVVSLTYNTSLNDGNPRGQLWFSPLVIKQDDGRYSTTHIRFIVSELSSHANRDVIYTKLQLNYIATGY